MNNADLDLQLNNYKDNETESNSDISVLNTGIWNLFKGKKYG